MKTGRKFVFAALLGALIVGGCDCQEKGKLVAKDPGGEGGSGGGVGGSGGDWQEPTPCEAMCEHVEGHCRLQVPELYGDCPAQCEEVLSEEERDCLAEIECSMEEVDRCLGREVPCEAICTMVYDQCGREILYGKGTAVEREDCETICPLLDEDYRRCLAEAQDCPAVDACHGTEPDPEPSACEAMCARVYDFCGEVIDQPGRSYPDRAACEAACGDGKFSEEEIDCLTTASCRDLESCFAPTACELMCGKIYDDCNYALPVGARKEDKVDRERCVSDCERGKFSAFEMSCVEEESCEYLATCFDDVSRSCAAVCYWVYNHCDVELGLTFGCFGGSCPEHCWMPPFGTGGDQVWFEGEGACFDYCEFGYQYQGACNPRSIPAWSSHRKTCYGEASQVYDYHQCKPAILANGGPLDACDATDPNNQ